jgi:twitching motility protein PilT
VLQGTVAQRLVRKAEGKGRLPINEIMMVTPAVRDYIIRNEMDEIYQLLKTSNFDGMCSMNMALYQAVRNGDITPEDALEATEQPVEFQQMLRGFYSGTR